MKIPRLQNICSQYDKESNYSNIAGASEDYLLLSALRSCLRKAARGSFEWFKAAIVLTSVAGSLPLAAWQFNGAAEGAYFSVDGSLVFSWFRDNKVHAWDASNGEKRWTAQLEDRIEGAILSADGGQLLTWSAEGPVHMLDASSGEKLWSAHHEDIIRLARYSHDEKQVLSISITGTIRVRDASNGDEQWSGESEGFVNHAIYSVDGTRIISWTMDTLRLWDAVSGEQLWSRDRIGFLYDAVFHPNGSQVISLSEDGGMRAWDVLSGVMLWKAHHSEGLVDSAVYSTDGRQILSRSWPGRLRVWHAQNGKEFWATGRSELVIPGSDASNDATERALEEGFRDNFEEELLAQQNKEVAGARYSDDESRILGWTAGDKVVVWDVSNRKEVWSNSLGEMVTDTIYSVDGKQVLAWTRLGMLRVWDASSGEEQWTRYHEASVLGARYSRDGSQVLSWSKDGTVRVWNAASGEEQWTGCHTGFVNGAAYSNSESEILSWSGDGSIRMWDALTGQQQWSSNHENKSFFEDTGSRGCIEANRPNWLEKSLLKALESVSLNMGFVFLALVCIAVYLLYSIFRTILNWTTNSYSKTLLSLNTRLVVIASFVYSVASVFIGPFIVYGLGVFVFGENGLVPSGHLIDCSDSSWGDTTLEEQEHVYQVVRAIAKSAAGVLFVIGFGLLMTVLLTSQQMGKSLAVLTGLLLTFMLCGYGTIMALANWLWGVCG